MAGVFIMPSGGEGVVVTAFLGHESSPTSCLRGPCQAMPGSISITPSISL